jgi:hypothetical protein
LSEKVNQNLSGGVIPWLHSGGIGPEGGLFLPRVYHANITVHGRMLDSNDYCHGDYQA